MRAIELIQALKNQQVSLPFIVLGNENDIPQGVSMRNTNCNEIVTVDNFVRAETDMTLKMHEIKI